MPAGAPSESPDGYMAGYNIILTQMNAIAAQGLTTQLSINRASANWVAQFFYNQVGLSSPPHSKDPTLLTPATPVQGGFHPSELNSTKYLDYICNMVGNDETLSSILVSTSSGLVMGATQLYNAPTAFRVGVMGNQTGACWREYSYDIGGIPSLQSTDCAFNATALQVSVTQAVARGSTS
jgi:hypothetical protein